MNRSFDILRAFAVGSILAATLFCIAVIAAAATYFMGVFDSAGGVRGISAAAFEELSDALTTGGFAAVPLDPRDPLLLARKIVITEEINERSARRVIDRLLHLDRVDPQAPIDLFISTSGGWSDSAFSIVDTIAELRAPVNTIAIGGCYSAGTLVLVSGTGDRTATPNAVISVHSVEMEEEEDEYSFDRIVRERTERHYRENASLPEEWFPMDSEDQYYLDATRALELGLIDKIRERRPEPPTT